MSFDALLWKLCLLSFQVPFWRNYPYEVVDLLCPCDKVSSESSYDMILNPFLWNTSFLTSIPQSWFCLLYDPFSASLNIILPQVSLPNLFFSDFFSLLEGSQLVSWLILLSIGLRLTYLLFTSSLDLSIELKILISNWLPDKATWMSKAISKVTCPK